MWNWQGSVHHNHSLCWLLALPQNMHYISVHLDPQLKNSSHIDRKVMNNSCTFDDIFPHPKTNSTTQQCFFPEQSTKSMEKICTQPNPCDVDCAPSGSLKYTRLLKHFPAIELRAKAMLVWSTSNAHPLTYSKAYFHHQFPPSSIFLRFIFEPFKMPLLVKCIAFHVTNAAVAAKKSDTYQCHGTQTHTHAKAIRQHERMYGKKMEKWKEPKTHRLYAINVNKIKLNLFVCWVHFTVCLFVLVKQKQSDKCKRTCVCVHVCVWAHVLFEVYFRCHHTILH